MAKHVKAYNLAKEEKDTYALMTNKRKMALPETDVLEHWKTRAKRKGVQAVMSARHSLKENIEATKLLQSDILDFLNGYLKQKRVFELGTGIGRMTSLLASESKEVVSCDISEIMLRRAKKNLSRFENVHLYLGKITDLDLKPKEFDLVFDSIVLLHILNQKELVKTAEEMKKIGNAVFLCEHVYEGADFPISKYSILRKPEEYEKLFKPFRLVKQKEVLCAGDRFMLMLLKK